MYFNLNIKNQSREKRRLNYFLGGYIKRNRRSFKGDQSNFTRGDKIKINKPSKIRPSFSM